MLANPEETAMTPDLTPEAWAQIRADYEHSETPIEDICAAHGISSGTLRNRMRRWNWTRRRPPISPDGPPPLPTPPPAEPAARVLPAEPHIAPAPPALPAAPQIASEIAGAPVDATPAQIARRLQGAVARVLPAIEVTLGKLTAQANHPREMERAARALAALTRTLRELNALLAQHAVPAEDDPKTLDEFRQHLMRRMDAIIAERQQRGADGSASGGA
jgi:transposase-like protein